jgi:predicted Rossmann fold nucleotide-binding protein DprA/Smf involved in DNA uptake
VNALPDGTTVISGGAKGVDTCAVETAKARGLAYIEHLPDLSGTKLYAEMTERYYARNTKIATDCDELVAFTEKPKGGTWNTIKTARALGKSVTINPIKETAMADTD